MCDVRYCNKMQVICKGRAHLRAMRLMLPRDTSRKALADLCPQYTIDSFDHVSSLKLSLSRGTGQNILESRAESRGLILYAFFLYIVGS